MFCRLFPAIMLFLSLGMVGCFDQSASNETTALEKTVNIGVTHCCDKTDVYMYKVYEGIQDAAKDYNGKVLLQPLIANNDQAQQEADISQLINANVDAMVVRLLIDSTKDFSFYQKVLEQTAKANIPIVLYVVNVDPLNFEKYPHAYYVGSIPAQSGILQGEAIIKGWQQHPEWDLNGDGIIQYAILKGIVDNPDAEGRTQWVSATVQNYPGKGIQAELVDLQVGNFRSAQAEQHVNNWMNSELADKIEIIVANNDDMALGAIKALKANNQMRPVFGVDALPEALHAIQKGDMAATILQDADAQARESLNLAVNLAAKRALNTGTEYKVIDKELMVPYIAIDKDNVNQFIQ